jgi:hypothetical protein
MKSAIQLLFGYRLPAAGLWLGVALMLCGSAEAQNLLKNGDFEAPMPGSDPTSNWAIAYVDGCSEDFSIATHTTEASRTGGGRGGHLRPNSYNSSHAYFRQVVTNLTAGARYTLTGLKMGTSYQPYLGTGQVQIYMVAVSGTSSNAVFAKPKNRGPYSLTIPAGPSRQIEVQLHLAKRHMVNESSEDMKHAKSCAWFDDFSLTLTQ